MSYTKRPAKTYGIFIDHKWWRTNNKKRAIEFIKHEGHGELREMSYNTETWDAPTFYSCSVQIFKL